MQMQEVWLLSPPSSPLCPQPAPQPAGWVPEPALVGQQHVQVALQRVLVEGAAQPGAAPSHVRGDVAQGVEALQLVSVEDLLHVVPEHGLCREGQWGVKSLGLPYSPLESSSPRQLFRLLKSLPQHREGGEWSISTIKMIPNTPSRVTVIK